MLLIMSSAYIGAEMQSEFGRLPPAMLPLGNRRLYQHQVRISDDVGEVYIALPGSYELAKHDLESFSSLCVTPVILPDGLSLGAAVVGALNIIGLSDEEDLELLLGDTLLNRFPCGRDLVAVARVDDAYNWTIVSGDTLKWMHEVDEADQKDQHLALVGYFRFCNPKELVRAIVSESWDFIAGLNIYGQSKGFRRVEVSDWLDFGHVNTYYQSKARFTTQRAFNTLRVADGVVTKTGTNQNKILAEANWYQMVPRSVKLHTPVFLGLDATESEISYSLEYLHLSALNELMVFADLPIYTWEKILKNCFEFLKCCSSNIALESSSVTKLSTLLSYKTMSRLTEWCSSEKVGLDTVWRLNGRYDVSIREMLEFCEQFLPEDQSFSTVVHGDFCFSNILYDFRSGRIKVVDPRGITTAGDFSIYGDVRYDMAKLAHSVLGKYDWIMSGNYSLAKDGRNLNFEIHANKKAEILARIFESLLSDTFNIDEKQINAMQIHLFLSMLPLHFDDKERQYALFSNALSIYSLFIERTV